MSYSEAVKNKAFELWASGKTIPDVSKETGVVERTIKRWTKSTNWRTKKAKIDQMIDKKVSKNVTELKLKQLDSTIEMIELWRAYLKEHPDYRPDDKTILAWMQHQLKILGEPTEIISTQENSVTIDRLRELYKKYKEK